MCVYEDGEKLKEMDTRGYRKKGIKREEKNEEIEQELNCPRVRN